MITALNKKNEYTVIYVCSTSMQAELTCLNYFLVARSWRQSWSLPSAYAKYWTLGHLIPGL